MSVNGKFKDFTTSDLIEEADKFRVGTAEAVIEQVRAAIARWPEFAALAGLPDAKTRRIAGEHLRLALLEPRRRLLLRRRVAFSEWGREARWQARGGAWALHRGFR